MGKDDGERGIQGTDAVTLLPKPSNKPDFHDLSESHIAQHGECQSLA
jgi:hypothetical protein